MFTSVFFRKGTRFVPITLGSLWLALLGGGSMLLGRYENTPGNTGTAPSDWPAASHLRQTTGLPTLVMTAHPKCPCTQASIAELAGLMAENPGRLNAHVLFYEPSNAEPSWRETASWQAAQAIPRVRVSADENGAEAARFGGETSGDVMLFDATGHLVFHGGITAARGQFGPSAGHTALNDFLAGKSAATHRTPVFGCPIEAPASTASLNP